MSPNSDDSIGDAGGGSGGGLVLVLARGGGGAGPRSGRSAKAGSPARNSATNVDAFDIFASSAMLYAEM